MDNDKAQSLWALDALNFCNAGIQTGLGPFISIFYTALRHWNPGQIGLLLACQSLTGIAVQSFVAHWVDESHNKRLLTILTQGKKGQQSAWEVATAVIVAETIMVAVAIWAGKVADQWGRKPLFLIGFAVLALRDVLTVVNHNGFI